MTEQVGGFAYLAEISKNTPSAANIVAYAMSVREAAMERFAIQRLSEAVEMLYSRNGMTAAQKYEAIQAISSQLTDHARTGSRRGARPLMDVMEDWLDELEGALTLTADPVGFLQGSLHLMRCYSQKGLYADPCWLSAPVRKWGKPRFTANWPSTARCMKTCRPSCSVWKCRTSKSSNAW
jgi:replicative DNA helicase